jgi:WD40 repeat protein
MMNDNHLDTETTNWGSIFLLVISLLAASGLVVSSVLAFSFSQKARAKDTQLALSEGTQRSLETQSAGLEETIEVSRTQAAELQLLLEEKEWAQHTVEALAEEYMQSAEQYASSSKGNRLAAEAVGIYQGSPSLGLLLAIEGVNSTLEIEGMPSSMAEEALRKILSDSGGISLIGHDQAINDIVISSDNSRIFSASRDGTIRIWDLTSDNPSDSSYSLDCLGEVQEHIEISLDDGWLATGGAHGSLCIWNLKQDPIPLDPISLEGHQSPIRTIAFNQASDSFFSVDSNGLFRIWDLSDPAMPSISFEYILTGDSISDADIDEDFTQMVATTYKGQIYLINVGTSEPSFTELDCPIDTPTIVSISSLHSVFLAAGDKKICVFDLNNVDTPPLVLSDFKENVREVSLSPDGQWLVGTSGDHLAYLWSMQDLSRPPIIHFGHEKPIIDSKFTSDSKQWITAGGDGRIFILDLTAMDPTQNIQLLRGHEDPIYSIDISDDSQWLVSGGYSGNVRLWNLASPIGDPWIITKQKSNPLAIHPDSRWLITSQDTHLQMWDLTQPATPPIQYEGFKNHILSAAFSSMGNIFAAGSWDETLHLWESFDPEQLETPITLSADNGITLVSMSPSGRWLLYNVGDRTDTYIIDLQSGDPTPVLLEGVYDDLASAAFSLNEKWLVAGGQHGSIMMWDLTRRESFSQPVTIGSARLSINELIFSMDSHYLIAQERDTLLLWDLSSDHPSWEPQTLEGHVGHLTDVDLSDDNQWIAASSIHGQIALWNIHDLSTIRFTLNHQAVDRIAFSPDGHWLASGGQDHLIRLWNMHSDDPGLSPIVMEGHEDMIYDLAFTPDGHWLITASSDSVRAWSISLDDLISEACRMAGRNITIEEWQVYLGTEPYRTTCPQYPAAVPVSYEPTPIP